MFTTPRSFALLPLLLLLSCGSGSESDPAPPPSAIVQPDAGDEDSDTPIDGSSSIAPELAGASVTTDATISSWMPKRSVVTGLLDALRTGIGGQALEVNGERFITVHAQASDQQLTMASSVTPRAAAALAPALTLQLKTQGTGNLLAFTGEGQVQHTDGTVVPLVNLAQPTPLTQGVTLGAWQPATGTGSVRLALLPAANRNQIRLCWLFAIPRLNQQLCTEHLKRGVTHQVQAKDLDTGAQFDSTTGWATPIQMLHCIPVAAGEAARFVPYSMQTTLLYRDGVLLVDEKAASGVTTQKQEDGSWQATQSQAGGGTLQYNRYADTLRWLRVRGTVRADTSCTPAQAPLPAQPQT